MVELIEFLILAIASLSLCLALDARDLKRRPSWTRNHVRRLR